MPVSLRRVGSVVRPGRRSSLSVVVDKKLTLRGGSVGRRSGRGVRVPDAALYQNGVSVQT
jgi:hypothetical protein